MEKYGVDFANVDRVAVVKIQQTDHLFAYVMERTA